MNCWTNKRHAYYNGSNVISLQINPNITVNSDTLTYFNFTCTSNTNCNLSFKIIGIETVMNGKAEDHLFLKQRYTTSYNITNQPVEYKYLINSEKLLWPVKLTKGSIKYRVEFYYNKINVCATKLNVIIPRNLVHDHIRKFVDSSKLLFSIEGSRILLLHSDKENQFLISPFRPRLIIVGTKKITSVKYSLLEKSEIKVRYKRSSWEPSMNIVKKEEKIIKTTARKPRECEYYDGMVDMPLEIIRLDEYAEPQVAGNYINIRHYMLVSIQVEDGNEYKLQFPVTVITN